MSKGKFVGLRDGGEPLTKVIPKTIEGLRTDMRNDLMQLETMSEAARRRKLFRNTVMHPIRAWGIRRGANRAHAYAEVLRLMEEAVRLREEADRAGAHLDALRATEAQMRDLGLLDGHPDSAEAG